MKKKTRKLFLDEETLLQLLLLLLIIKPSGAEEHNGRGPKAMSRREGRDSHAKRLNSRSERDPSPKKSRRDGKQAIERMHSSSHHLDTDATDQDRKQRRGLPDALLLETPATETKMHSDTIKGSTRKVDGVPDGNKPSLDAKEVPRVQHNERGSAGHGGGSLARRAPDHGRWSSPKEQPGDKFRGVEPHWRHDRFTEPETEAPPARKRPAFREKKLEGHPKITAAAVAVAVANRTETTGLPTARRDERVNYSRGLENKLDRPIRGEDGRNLRRGDGPFLREDPQRAGYQLRERFGGGEGRGRDRFNNGRYRERGANHEQTGGFQVDKWKHDLYDEANRSPSPKKEEEQIAKVEALLAL